MKPKSKKMFSRTRRISTLVSKAGAAPMPTTDPTTGTVVTTSHAGRI